MTPGLRSTALLVPALVGEVVVVVAVVGSDGFTDLLWSAVAIGLALVVARLVWLARRSVVGHRAAVTVSSTTFGTGLLAALFVGPALQDGSTSVWHVVAAVVLWVGMLLLRSGQSGQSARRAAA